jgi:exopolyphosphatase / guanosine-5'-triphosphate,3'-diphosphate pyrophosphatase
MGSGTSRLVVYAFEPGKHFRLVDEIRETTRLGEGLAKNNQLSPQGMRRTLAALKLYRDFAGATELEDLRVVATSAARDAENGPQFMREIHKLGLSVRVLSGEDEARYGVKAVANSFAFTEAWVMDLGGGSAQLSSMNARKYTHGRAYPLGAVRLTEKFFSHDPPKKNEIEDLVRFTRREMKDILGEVKANPMPIVAMGGTIRNLAKLVQKQKKYPLDLLHGYFLSAQDLEKLLEGLLAKPTAERRQIDGIQADRADIIVAGGIVYRTVLRETGLDGVWISGQGVREGVFYEEMFGDTLTDVRSFSVHNMFARYPQEPQHTARVRKFCRQLFEQLALLHGYGPDEAKLLDEAALLHDIGMSMGYYDHHKHGEYLIAGAAIAGLTHREQALLSLLVRYHRKGEPKPGPYKDLLEDGDNKRLLRLATLLRIAEYLERSRAGRVQAIEANIVGQVRLGLQADEEPWVEIAETSKQAGLFEQAFGMKLEVCWLG